MLQEYLREDEDSDDGAEQHQPTDELVDLDDAEYYDDYEADMDAEPLSTGVQPPQLEPPLPLFDFDKESVSHKPVTIDGDAIESVEHLTFETDCGSPLHNPLHSRRLAKWFTIRDGREEFIRNSSSGSPPLSDDRPPPLIISDALVYENCRFQNTSGNDLSQREISDSFSDKQSISSSIVFDSDFESGNLRRALRVIGREQIRITETSDCAVPSDVDQEYDLMIRKDVHTNGNIQWYYFRVTTPASNVSYPLTVRFNLVNMLKKNSLYNYGMRPATYCAEDETREVGWSHEGRDVCYFKNRQTYNKGGGSAKKKHTANYFTLSFSFTFIRPCTVYFAHCFPYTYTKLQNLLVKLETDDRISKFTRRRLLCHTLAKNRCELLTITEPCENAEIFGRRPAIVVTARAHPGETNSSFMMEGFLDFLVSEDPNAKLLRSTFVFKIVPMLNPDGVIHGNYRSSLAGCDLNRRYRSPDPYLHPTIYAVKDLILSSHFKRGVLLYLDLHGHSTLKNTFLYGCDPTQTDDFKSKEKDFDNDASARRTNPPLVDRQVFSRLFPKLLSQISTLHPFADSALPRQNYFSYSDCCFRVQNGKRGAGRVVCWNDIGIEASYTVEISFCGRGDNTEARCLDKLFNSDELNREVFTSSSELDIDMGYICDLANESDIYNKKSEYQKNKLKLLENFSTSRTYSIYDLLRMGRDLALAIKLLSNVSYSGSALNEIDGEGLRTVARILATTETFSRPQSAYRYPQSSNADPTILSLPAVVTTMSPVEKPPSLLVLSRGESNALSVSDMSPRDDDDCELEPARARNIILPRVDIDFIDLPMLRPCVFAPNVLDFVTETCKKLSGFTESNDAPSSPIRWRNSSMSESISKFSVRALIESIIRNDMMTEGVNSRFKNRCGAFSPIVNPKRASRRPSSSRRTTSDSPVEGNNDGESESDKGSDSDPSGDEIPLTRLLRRKGFKKFLRTAKIPSAGIIAAARKRLRKKSKYFDPITYTKGFIQMMAPRKASISAEDPPEISQKVGKVVNLGSIQRLHEGKAVYEAELNVHPSIPAKQYDGSNSPPPITNSVKMQAFEFNTIRKSRRSSNANILSGFRSEPLGIAFSNANAPKAPHLPSKAKTVTEALSQVGIGPLLKSESQSKAVSNIRRYSAENVAKTIEDPFSAEKVNVSWKKAYAAASAVASGSVKETKAASDLTRGHVYGLQNNAFPRVGSEKNISNSTSHIDWRFHKRDDETFTNSTSTKQQNRPTTLPTSASSDSFKNSRSKSSKVIFAPPFPIRDPLFHDKEIDRIFRSHQS